MNQSLANSFSLLKKLKLLLLSLRLNTKSLKFYKDWTQAQATTFKRFEQAQAQTSTVYKISKQARARAKVFLYEIAAPWLVHLKL